MLRKNRYGDRKPKAGMQCKLAAALPGLLLAPEQLCAAEAGAVGGSGLGLIWVLPFVGMLLSIALLPLLAPKLWHHHDGKISLFWALAYIVPAIVLFGGGATLDQVLHVLFLEYLPFLVLIGTLFTIAGGIYVSGNLHGSPGVNTAILAIGTVLASFIGTTGASMLLIRPLLRANDDRRHNAHTVIFFIFLVSNIGGSLTPLGDPPLFLGFLKGVPFLWPLQALWLPMLVVSASLLLIFFILDSYIYSREGRLKVDPTPDRSLGISGLPNAVLLILVLGVVLASGSVDLGALRVRGFDVPISGLLRDAALIGLAYASLRITRAELRAANHFTWDPVLEVARLFAAIFITIIPAIAILQAGETGALAPLLRLVSNEDGSPNNAMYFWLTGILSSFLDNAPTYLIFFNTAGGEAAELYNSQPVTLMAISAGAVFMGANTYIGNAPNFMVKSIAEQRSVRMPSFIGYMGWSCAVLLPLFALITAIFFTG